MCICEEGTGNGQWEPDLAGGRDVAPLAALLTRTRNVCEWVQGGGLGGAGGGLVCGPSWA